LSHAAKEVCAWQHFFASVQFDVGHQISISCDNQQTIRVLSNQQPQFATKLRHIDVHQLWLRQEVLAGRIHLNWVPTADMPADGLTKALTRQKHEAFVQQLGLVHLLPKITDPAAAG
jgi:hypothetical protein